MEPIVWLDAPLSLLGAIALALSARGWLRRQPRRAWGTIVMFFLGVGTLAAAVIDVGLSEWEKNDRRSQAEQNRGVLLVGSPAPDFSLPRLDDGKTVRLSDFRGRKPVCLIFGSFS